MSPQLLYHLQQSSPFRTLQLHLTDGRALHFENSECFSLADDGQSFLIFTPPGTYEYLDPSHIVSAKVSMPTP